jgi:tetratricopeptide (TPR) repeat protein
MHTVPGAFAALQRLYAEGEACLGQGRLDEAVAKFSEGIAIDDHFRQRYVTMYAQRGFALQRLGRLQEAISDYGRAIEMEPEINRAQYLFHRGMCWSGLSQPERAVADHTASIALHDGHPGPFHLRGKIYVDELQRYAEGIADFDRFLTMREHPEVYTLRGFAKHMLGDLRGALADLARSSELRPDTYNDCLAAFVHADAGDADAVFAAIARAVASDRAYVETFAPDERLARFRSDPRFAAALEGRG